MSDQPDAQAALKRDRHPYPPARFEPTIPAIKRPQTQTLDRAAIAINLHDPHSSQNIISVMKPRIIRLARHVARIRTGEVRRRFWLGDLL